MANKDKAATGTVENVREAGAKTAADFKNLKTSRNEDIIVPEDLDMSGFITGDRNSKADDKDWAKVNLTRKMYKPDFCAPIGGVRGILLKSEESKSPKAVNKKNPDGIFTMLLLRLTAPAPVVNDKGKIGRAEVGEDVIVVMTHQLKKLAKVDENPTHTAEVELKPLQKIVLGNGNNMWEYECHVNTQPVPRASIPGEMLFSAAERTHLLGEAEKTGDAANSQQSASA